MIKKKVLGKQSKEKILFSILAKLSSNVGNTKYHEWKYSQTISAFIDIENVLIFFSI